jgi:hypothetical protein
MPAVCPFPGRGLPGLSDRAQRPGRGKKLKEAARAWAFARRGLADPDLAVRLDSKTAADFAALGLSVPDTYPTDPNSFDVMRANWRAVTAFLALETQWRVVAGPTGLIWCGLDYAAAAAVFRGRNRRAWQRLLGELKVMEAAALEVLNG